MIFQLVEWPVKKLSGGCISTRLDRRNATSWVTRDIPRQLMREKPQTPPCLQKGCVRVKTNGSDPFKSRGLGN